jgi:hypothetical protein
MVEPATNPANKRIAHDRFLSLRIFSHLSGNSPEARAASGVEGR